MQCAVFLSAAVGTVRNVAFAVQGGACSTDNTAAAATGAGAAEGAGAGADAGAGAGVKVKYFRRVLQTCGRPG